MNPLPLPLVSRALIFAGLAASVGSTSAAVVAQAPSNNTPLTAQVLNGSFSAGPVAEIHGSSNPYAQHVTVRSVGNSAAAWYFFTHIGGDIIVDIDDNVASGQGPAPDLMVGLFNALGQLVSTSDNQLIVDVGSSSLQDPFLTEINAPMINYYVAVLATGGTFASGFIASGSGAPISSAYDMHITVPEPSAALLGLLGAGFMFRRRRA